tara:strand:- start:998 stop:1315 length:318 start_codon:yes stop_codon:yes gene_type:complete
MQRPEALSDQQRGENEETEEGAEEGNLERMQLRVLTEIPDDRVHADEHRRGNGHEEDATNRSRQAGDILFENNELGHEPTLGPAVISHKRTGGTLMVPRRRELTR